MPPTLTATLRNLGRGGRAYRSMRRQTAQALFAHPQEAAEELSPFLRKTLLKIDGEWMALTFDDRDWAIMERFSKANTTTTQNILSLTLQYIEENIEAVNRLYAFERNLSRVLLTEGADAAAGMTADIKGADTHSLLMYRLYAALSSGREELLDSFSGQQYSEWFRRRFLYPFVYWFVNKPGDSYLDYHLSYAMPPGHANQAERSCIRFLLKDELAYDQPLAFKCYIALLTHPYDAAEILFNDIENAYARNGALNAMEAATLKRLGAAISESVRLKRFTSMVAAGEPCPFKGDEPPVGGLAETFGEDGPAAQVFAQCFSFAAELDPAAIASAHLGAIARIRMAKYPTVVDYDTIVTVGRGYWHTTAGRAINTLLTSLYLFPRRDAVHELKETVRGALTIGAATPFVLAAPRGRVALERRLLSIANCTPPEAIGLLGLGVPEPGAPADRCWIKSVHWTGMALEKSGLVSEWLALMRKHIAIAPAYVTGIDWDWFDQMLAVKRITPFLGSAPAAYVLLLRLVEESRKDATALRLTLEPIAKGARTTAALVDWLDHEFGVDALAFLRFFLTADLILWLGLAPTYAAALTERIEALERLAKKHGLNTPLLSEASLVEERKAFTAALLLINVGANQFEISWDGLARDAALKDGELFDTFLAFRHGDQESPFLSASRNQTPYPFANGETRKYVVINRDWPLISVILGVIDTFMEHPSQGIEAILSIRIRHNCFRREFTAALDGLKNQYLSGVPMSDRTHWMPRFETPVLAEVQNWVDARMHQARTQKPEALFDFIPTQAELDALVADVQHHETFKPIAEHVTAWIKQRLAQQLSAARFALQQELLPRLHTAVDTTIASIQQDPFAPPSIAALALAVKSVLTQRCNELEEWFSLASSARELSVGLDDLRLAVAARFASYVDSGRLCLDAMHAPPAFEVERQQVRQLFDLWCEAVGNALKHSGMARATIRVAGLRTDTELGLVFSSTTVPRKGERNEQTVLGHPYLSLHEELFREGNSGLPKVASLAASIAGQMISIKTVETRHGFHLIVPLRVL